MHWRILLGLAIGVVGGTVANVTAGGSPWLTSTVDYVIESFGRIFLRLIFMVVLPLASSSAWTACSTCVARS